MTALTEVSPGRERKPSIPSDKAKQIVQTT